MKKLFLLAIIPLCLFIACSDDNNPTSDELLKQKLIDVGEWENYGYYIIEKGKPNDVAVWVSHYEDAWYWTFENSSYTIKKDDSLLEYNYQIKNDSIYAVRSNSADSPTPQLLEFVGDSCIMTENWNNIYKKRSLVLYPKGYKK